MTTGDNRFVFVACSYNMSRTLPQMLASIVAQSYSNWKVVITDDVSDPDQLEQSLGCIERFRTFLGPEGPCKLVFHANERKKWEVENVITMIKGDCAPDDIVCRIDADDWLTDVDALAMLDSAYRRTSCDALWTAHRWGYSDKNISGPMPDGADPYAHPWVSSHLKTFRRWLIDDVTDENFRGSDGGYVRRAGDQAVYLPVLVNARRRAFLPRCTYHYTIDDVPETYATEDARFQRDEALFLRARGYVR